MKKIKKKDIISLILLIIMLILQIKAFNNSRANKLTDITARIIDSSGFLDEEICTMQAINEAESGMVIVLPNYINCKKVNKYNVIKKEIVSNELEENILIENDIEINTENEDNSNIVTINNDETSNDETSNDEISNDETSNVEINDNEISSEEINNNEISNEEINNIENDLSDGIEIEDITQNIEKETIIELRPGDKLYLTDEEQEKLEIQLTVEYDVLEVESNILYNQKLILKDEEDYELLEIIGYMPLGANIKSEEIDITNVQDKILEVFPYAMLIGNYDLNLFVDNQEINIKDYGQELQININIVDENNIYCLLETDGENLSVVDDYDVEEQKIKFKVQELKGYLVLELPGEDSLYGDSVVSMYAIETDNSKFEIDDYEADKNYYLGLNYTENKSQINSGKYTEENLKDVTINYYSYDYNLTEFVVPEEYDINLSATATRTATGSVSQTGNGNNRVYYRNDTITCTVTGINSLSQYGDFSSESGWVLEMQSPNNNFTNYFSSTRTETANSSNGISVSLNNRIITVTGSDISKLKETSDTWTFTFYVTIASNNNNNVNNTTYTNFTVNSFGSHIIVGGEYTPYGTISNSEAQTLVSYRKCVPVDQNGNVSIELIDNPFLNRPLKKGFNGWKTNNTNYSNSIITNSNTFTQTLTTSLNNISNYSGNYVIDLYPDWIDANVVFVSSSGNSANNGLTINTPIDNSWNSINSKLNENIKTCSKASNREANIVVLMSGTLDISGLTGPNTAYTLTSLYNGVNYANANTYLNVGTTNIQLDSDIQIHHLNISSSVSYTSPTASSTDGTHRVAPCLYGNMYNLRLGRGLNPTNTNNCTWGQIQGGYYNHSSSEFKLVIESGKYYTAQLYRCQYSSNTGTTTDTGATTATTANGYLVLGSDIDRKNNNNNSLRIYNRVASKTSTSTSNPYNGGKVVNMYIKSGTIGVDFFNGASTADSSDRNYAGIYVGGHGQTGYDKSDRYIIVEGGNIANIIGGLNMSVDDMFKTYIRVKDGNVINITGGAGYTRTYGDRIIQVTGGYIKYSISGGSNGVAASSDTNNGQVVGESLIYIGGNAQIGASSSIGSNGSETVTVTNTEEVLYGVNAGSVCGGANGNGNYAGQTDASYIIIDGNAIVHNNVFGGGNYGIIGSTDTVQGADILTFNNETSNFTTNTEYLITTSTYGGNGLLASGTSLANEAMSTALEPSASSKWVFENYSGNQYYIKNASTGAYIYISNINSSWFSCSADLTLSTTNKTAFTVGGTTTKTITSQYTTTGWLGQTFTMYLNYDNGWGLSSDYGTNQLYLLTYEMLPPSEVIEDVATRVNIKVFGGNVVNNIFGGANQNNIYGTVDIDIENGIVNGVVYGGSNIKGTISGSVLMDITGGQLGTTSTTDGFDYSSIDVVFGGGLGAETNVKERVLININDLKNNLKFYGNVYGGSSLGTISSNIEINIQDLPSTTNTASISGYVFGGGKGNSSTAAVVTGDVTINVDGSNLSNCSVFGGSNINGTISGTITVNIGKTYESTLLAVYGGGNQASIGTETQEVYVYLLSNANVTNAFNGGKAADLISSGVDDTTRAIYLQGGAVQNLYGGSDSSGTVTASHVYIEAGNATNVYGGNNQGGTTTITNVFMNGGTISNIYGGGEKAESTTSNIITTGGTANYIFGGGNQAGVTTTNVQTLGGNIGTIFGGSNTSGDVNESFVTTNDASNSGSDNEVEMAVTTTVANAEWRSTTYPTYAKINVVFTNNTSDTITTWNANVFVLDSILYSNYSQSDIQVNNGVYTLNEKNRYYGNNTIPAGGTYSVEFEILTMQSIEDFSIGYGISGQDSSGNSVSYTKSIIGTVYGGNNQGGRTQTTNVTINGGGVQDVYGGGDQAVSNLTNVNINGEVQKRVFGGGNQAGVNTNTNVTLTEATVGGNVYGGGNEGTVSKNTYVIVKDSNLKDSLYAGGNGTSAIVYGNVNLTMHGTKNEVTNSIFGGGNQAATGTESSNNSVSTVNIAGGKIGKNVYGGANTSVVYGRTQTNIGYDTIGDEELVIGDVIINGTVFGGGEANASGSEIFDFDFISVTVAIDIQIDAANHTNFNILGSIFGSGNASSTSGTSNITIKNYGTSEKPQSNVSIQRTDCATLINSAISLYGTTDRTNEYSAVFFSLSRVDELKLKNNSTLYLCNGANLLKLLESAVDEDGEEVKGYVTIDEDTGEITKNVDNRIYMLEGKNLNVALNEKATLFGQVQGMFFFGLFTNRNNPATSTGLYHSGYNNGDTITNIGTFVSNSYVIAEHLTNPEHDIKVDGFYTNYNEEGIIKTDYIHPTPDADVYYMWLCGEEMEVKVFSIDMVASKYATLGTYELALSGFSNPNIKFIIAGFSSGLISTASLVDYSTIEPIEPDEEKANNYFGLTMRTGNVGWQTKGNTSFLTENGGSYQGSKNYNSDNTNYTPTLDFCFYHSQNLTKKQALGEVKIRFQVLAPIDDLNYKVSYIDINVTLATALFQDDYYEAAITPGQEFGLFTTTDTTITKSSAFSVYYSLLLKDLTSREDYNVFSDYRRVLVSRDIDNLPYSFPENTKITMLDMVTNQYYYYIVTADDVTNGKFVYALTDFIAMGSTDNNFDEEEMFYRYYNTSQNLLYENFIFHVNFADSTLNTTIPQNSLLMELRNNENQTILGVLGIQRENIIYTVFCDKEATIEVNGTIDPEVIYLGRPINLNVTTIFTQEVIGTKTIYDTQYFDKKLGIKISIYDSNGNRLNNDSLLGLNFELNGQYYYPRVDGTTRICIADKVTDVLAKIRINTENNTTIATGDYKIKVESFGSSDGIYYGLLASDVTEIDLTIINFAYGLKAITRDIAKVVDYKTGKTEDDSNVLMTALEYSSSLNNPKIAISLYRRDYTDIYSQNYVLVDLKDYVSNILQETPREKEYFVSEVPVADSRYFLYLKENLITGTYKLVYKLYDSNTYIGEVFEYMIIK